MKLFFPVSTEAKETGEDAKLGAIYWGVGVCSSLLTHPAPYLIPLGARRSDHVVHQKPNEGRNIRAVFPTYESRSRKS